MHHVQSVNRINLTVERLRSTLAVLSSKCSSNFRGECVFRWVSVKQKFTLNRCSVNLQVLSLLTFCGGGISWTIGVELFLAGCVEISSGLRRFFEDCFTAFISIACGCKCKWWFEFRSNGKFNSKTYQKAAWHLKALTEFFECIALCAHRIRVLWDFRKKSSRFIHT